MPRIVISTQKFMFADMIKRTLEGGDFYFGKLSAWCNGSTLIKEEMYL